MEERTAHISADPGRPPEEGRALPPHIRLRQHRTGSISMTFSAVRPIAGSVAVESDDEDSSGESEEEEYNGVGAVEAEGADGDRISQLSQPSPTLARSAMDSVYGFLDRGSPLSKDQLSSEDYEQLNERRRLRREAAFRSGKAHLRLHKRPLEKLERIFEKYGATRIMASSLPLERRSRRRRRREDGRGYETAQSRSWREQSRDMLIRELSSSRSHRKNLEKQQQVLHEQAERLRLLIEQSMETGPEKGQVESRGLNTDGNSSQPTDVEREQQPQRQRRQEDEQQYEREQQTSEQQQTGEEIMQALAVGLVGSHPATSDETIERTRKMSQTATFYEDMDDLVAMRKSERHRRIQVRLPLAPFPASTCESYHFEAALMYWSP